MKTTTAVRGLALGLAALPLAVQAQVPSTVDAPADELNPLVITATLAPRTAEETLSSVTVLDEAALRRQDPASLTDLLRGQPGVDVSTNGSFGKNSSVYLRGTGNAHSLLMIDGIRLRSATAGGAAWQYLDPRMFQRAEIVRGPLGSLYGADAVGGVVQLFTHAAEEGGPHPRISVGGGSFNTQRYSAGLSGGSGGTRYSFAGSHFSTDGTAIHRGGEDKGYDNTTGLVRLSHTFDNGAEIGGLALRARGNTEFDSFGEAADTDFVQQVAGIYGEVPITANWRSRLTLSEARDEQQNYYPSSESVFDTRTRTARWDNSVSLGAHEVILGAEYMHDAVTTTDDFQEDSRHSAAFFAQGLWDFSPFLVQTSLRYDDYEDFGDEVTGTLALGYELDSRHTLRASYGTAFRAPTFNDLYYRDEWGSEGNPDVAPETSSTFEVGLRGQYARSFWDLAIYQTSADDLIAWTADPENPYRWTPMNVDEARIRGAELAIGAELDAWMLRAALTYTDPENRSDEYRGNRLVRRTTQSARLDIDRELGEWSLGGSWIMQNHRYEDEANTDRIGGFGLVNLRAGWRFAPLWSVRLTLENAFDKEYGTSRDYLNAGRAAYVSLDFGG